MLLHSSLIVTTGGLPLGLAAASFWTRQESKRTNVLKRSLDPTRVPLEQKESVRWRDNLQQTTVLLGAPERYVHIGERKATSTNCSVWRNKPTQGSFCATASTASPKTNRGQWRPSCRFEEAVHRIEVADRNGYLTEVMLESKYRGSQFIGRKTNRSSTNRCS